MRLRRSLIYMPATDWRKIEKAATELAADCICMDLEDGTALDRKAEGRETTIKALKTLSFQQSERLVRINGVDTSLAALDLAAILSAHPDGIVVPKVSSAAELAWVDSQITQAEQVHGWEPGGIGLVAIIESASGVVNLREICAATPRTQALIFGAEDFGASIGAVRTPAAWEVFYGRSAVITHAAAFGLQALDMVYADFRDPEGFTMQARQGLELGYHGKQLIHPAQVPLIHAVYTPTREQVAQAQRLVAAFHEHQAAGAGAFALDGGMVDMPLLKAAEQTLARARAAGVLI